MKPRIVVVGSSNTDMIVQLDRLPQAGETVLGGEFSTAPGGKGANQAVAAARAGGKVTFVARVGRDRLGDEALAAFRRAGLDTDFVIRDARKPSGVALVFVARDGENSIAVAGGANCHLTPSDVHRARAAIAAAALVVLQLETPLPAIQAAADLATRAGVRVILNPAPARRLPKRLLQQVSLLTPNETEAEILTGIRLRSERDLRRAADRLLAMGVGFVVLTLGARGAYVAHPDHQEWVPGFQVKAIDTTAAGDVFNGALAVALGEGRRVVDAVRFGHAAAAISVTRLGAQPSAPSRPEIERMLHTARL